MRLRTNLQAFEMNGEVKTSLAKFVSYRVIFKEGKFFMKIQVRRGDRRRYFISLIKITSDVNQWKAIMELEISWLEIY